MRRVEFRIGLGHICGSSLKPEPVGSTRSKTRGSEPSLPMQPPAGVAVVADAGNQDHTTIRQWTAASDDHSHNYSHTYTYTYIQLCTHAHIHI